MKQRRFAIAGWRFCLGTFGWLCLCSEKVPPEFVEAAIITIGRPVAAHDTDANRAKNRRVELAK